LVIFAVIQNAQSRQKSAISWGYWV